MSVRTLGKTLASELHRAALKPRGFKKSGNTFTLERDDYVEMLQIQGSNWNSGAEPWTFYVNVLVRFKNLANSYASTGYEYDADGRIDKIVPDAPPRFEVTEQNLAELAMVLAGLSAQASLLLPELLGPVRERASRGFYSPIPVPASWLTGEG